MGDCKKGGNHEWLTRPSGKKEHCAKCGVSRAVGSGPCQKLGGKDHDYVPDANGKKETCSACGARRNLLHVRSSVLGTGSTKPKTR
jgi:ribosomal protein L37E